MEYKLLTTEDISPRQHTSAALVLVLRAHLHRLHRLLVFLFLFLGRFGRLLGGSLCLFLFGLNSRINHLDIRLDTTQLTGHSFHTCLGCL